MPKVHTEVVPGGGESGEVPSGSVAGVASTPRKTTKKKEDAVSESYLGKKMAKDPWKAEERILGRWTIGGNEPYKVYEGDEEQKGSRNLLESRRNDLQSF